jgi:hypothetical protein
LGRGESHGPEVHGIVTEIEPLVLDAQREAAEAHLNARAVRRVGVLSVLGERQHPPFGFPTRETDAAVQVDERQREQADRRNGQRLRVDRRLRRRLESRTIAAVGN